MSSIQPSVNFMNSKCMSSYDYSYKKDSQVKQHLYLEKVMLHI
jgi:hypothetical protein